MAGTLEFVLNGRSVREEDWSPNTTLLVYLHGIGLTGSKEGCAEGDCGACSVAILDRDSQGQGTYRAINSCLVPVCLMAGREIVSVEGVSCQAKVEGPKSKVKHAEEAPGTRTVKLHPVQEKMV